MITSKINECVRKLTTSNKRAAVRNSHGPILVVGSAELPQASVQQQQQQQSVWVDVQKSGMSDLVDSFFNKNQ